MLDPVGNTCLEFIYKLIFVLSSSIIFYKLIFREFSSSHRCHKKIRHAKSSTNSSIVSNKESAKYT